MNWLGALLYAVLLILIVLAVGVWVWAALMEGAVD